MNFFYYIKGDCDIRYGTYEVLTNDWDTFYRTLKAIQIQGFVINIHVGKNDAGDKTIFVGLDPVHVPEYHKYRTCFDFICEKLPDIFYNKKPKIGDNT